MSKKSYLDSIKSPAPCSKDWDEMTGDELVRFCSGCEKSVYNLSAMPRREAKKFVARNSGKVCVRYVRLSNGKVQTADTRLYKITRQTSRLAAGVLGATLTLSAISQAQTTTPSKTEKEKTVKSQNKDYSKTSQISFTVFDSNGTPIPNAEVKLINSKTKQEFIAITNQEGVAQFSLIPPALYEVKSSAEYFKTKTNPIKIKEKIEPNIRIILSVQGIEFVGDVVDTWSEIPLFTLIAQEDNDAVKKLIFSGFDVNTKDKSNRTALHIAVENENLELVRFLIEHGAKVNVKNKDKLTPIMMLEESFGNDEKTTIEILRLLISKGVDVNLQNDNKETLLIMACFDDDIEAAKILLAAGANPNLKDEDGETALQKTKSEEIKRLLISYGAKE